MTGGLDHSLGGPEERFALDAAAMNVLLSVSEPIARGRQQPGKLGPRGALTRQRLLSSARTLFEVHGYGRVSVLQISEHAGMSQGTFYQYFNDRAHIMSTLVVGYVAALVSNAALAWSVDDGREGVAQLLRFYVRDYVDNAAFASVWEEVCQIDPAFADSRRRLTRFIEHGVEQQIRRGIAHGLLDPPGDIGAIARALTAMADRFCFLTYSFDRGRVETDWRDGAELLTEMWWRMLRSS
ncbi:TetR/AcrR family transcriptional regulator [Nocardia sp. NPDC056100]|uniref:TetR/AcrR family transcriptional regulator n=1 Tax=Nocardia sp. NPDC056100 TaxID=3345712 RepID=UPI0035D6725B